MQGYLKTTEYCCVYLSSRGVFTWLETDTLSWSSDSEDGALWTCMRQTEEWRHPVAQHSSSAWNRAVVTWEVDLNGLTFCITPFKTPEFWKTSLRTLANISVSATSCSALWCSPGDPFSFLLQSSHTAATYHESLFRMDLSEAALSPMIFKKCIILASWLLDCSASKQHFSLQSTVPL